MPYRTKCSSVVHKKRGKVSEAQLRALIERDRDANCVVTSRGNKISRNHYSKFFGCTPGAMGRFRHVFAEYERELNIVTGPLSRLPAMREWLTAAYNAGELEIRNGKLARLAFQAHFKLRGGTFLVRHEPIRALFNEFEARAQREGYLPRVKQQELDRLQAALADQPLLNRDRKTINRVALARVVDVPMSRFQEKPFEDLIAAREAVIIAQVQASKIDAFVGERIYSFGDLEQAWSKRFVERVGVRFKQVATGWASPKAPYLQLFNALRWIGLSDHPNCRVVVVEAIKDGRVKSAGDWEDALFAYRDHLVAGIPTGETSGSAVNGNIKALRSALEGLSSGRVAPSMAVPLPGVKYVRQRSRHLSSVAEAVGNARNRKVADYVNFARARLLEACKASGVELSKGESEEFIDGLAVEIRGARDLPTDLVAAIRSVLERRLNALVTRASAIVDGAIEGHQRGRELLSIAQIDGAKFEAAYIGGSLNSYERRLLVRRFFPDPAEGVGGKVEQAIANLLKLIIQQHRGIPPAARGAASQSYGQFFSKRYLEYGGLQTIAPMLNPDPEAVGAVLTLYLIESGANVSVGRTLDRDCIEVSDLEGCCRITGYKARANGKPIIVDLEEVSPAVRAIQWLSSASERLRAAAAQEDVDRLFLMRIGQRVQVMSPHWYTNWFKRFAASVPGLDMFTLVPSMIRPSVLLHAALGNDGRLSTGVAIGQHGLTVSQGYQQKWPTRLLYDENIRHFQSAFETLVMSGVEEAASKLGITVEQFETRMGDLQETGLGTFCRDKKGRSGEKGATCSSLDCWNNCPHLLIVAELEAIAALQLWQASLKAAQPDWERDRPERWDATWLPWLCLTDVVEEKMVRGPMIRIWKDARRRANEIASQPGYVPPQPW